MPPREDYQSKYGPMIQLLDAEADRLYITETARPDQRKALLVEYEINRRQTLKSYLNDLAGDYKRLYKAAAADALHNPDLAERVARLDKDFRKSIRFIRLRLFFEALLPNRRFQQFVTMATSRPAANQLVLSMDLVRGKLL